MKKFYAFAALSLMLLTGCGSPLQGTDAKGNKAPQHHYAFYQDLPDGRTVLCVWAKSGYGGGVSCDWSTAK